MSAYLLKSGFNTLETKETASEIVPHLSKIACSLEVINSLHNALSSTKVVTSKAKASKVSGPALLPTQENSVVNCAVVPI